MQPGIYRHYKNKNYEVIGVGHHTETMEELVFYRARYDAKDICNYTLWVRPKSMFCENVVVDGKEVPRFQYIGPVYK